MKTKLIKIIVLLLMILLVFSNSIVFAEANMFADPTTGPNNYRPNFEEQNSQILKDKVGGILGVINTVGIVCSVLVLVIIGLRYMLGSVEAKAEYKKTMLGYVIGVALLASATTLPNILYKIGTSLTQLPEDPDVIILPNGENVTEM